MSSSSYTAGILSGNEILDLLNFCMKLLNEGQALEIAQMDSLEMLNHLCSQPQYVVSYNKKHPTYIVIVAFVYQKIIYTYLLFVFPSIHPGIFSSSY